MTRKYEEPVVTKNNDPMGGDEITHPAFGNIQASRVTGHKNLYGSEFHHHGYITIRIAHARMRRSLSRDWHYTDGRNEIVEVCLSEAQWAHFVSSLNSFGTQCTISHIQRQGIPELPDPPSRQEQFDKELKEAMGRSQEALKELSDKIKDLKLSEKMKKELLDDVSRASRSIGGSAGFVAESFSEHMEQQTEKAKCEVNAYVEGQIRRVGLQQIREESTEKLIGWQGPIKELTDESND